MDATKIIRQALGNTGDNPEADSLRPGGIQATDETLTDPAEVIQRLHRFGGTGWVCTAESQKVNLLPAEMPENGYTLHAEVANGDSSLHIRQDGKGGWTLTTLQQTSDPDDGLLYDSTLLVRGDQQDLGYTVCCTPEGDPEAPSLRPTTARFTGFIDKQ